MTAMPSLREEVERKLRQLDGAVEGESMFSDGQAWWVNGKEIAHFHTDDELEIRLTKAVIREQRAALKADDRVTLRPSGADWITVTVTTAKDVTFVVTLVEQAAAAHRPPPGQTASRRRVVPTSLVVSAFTKARV